MMATNICSNLGGMWDSLPKATQSLVLVGPCGSEHMDNIFELYLENPPPAI